MKYIAVSRSDVLHGFLTAQFDRGDQIRFLVTGKRACERMAKAGLDVRHVRIDNRSWLRQADVEPGDVFIIFLPRPSNLQRLVTHVVDLQVDCSVIPILHSHLEYKLPESPRVRPVYTRELFEPHGDHILHLQAIRSRIQAVRNHFANAERILILLHDDPDPDGIAAGLALRTLLGRKPQTSPLASYKPVTRPENLQMLADLSIDIVPMEQIDLARFERIALVDVQPPYFGDRHLKVDLVIDHHPELRGYSAPFREIHVSYGSSSTMMTEFLRAAEVEINQRLATALFYAVKTDTQFLQGTHHVADLRSFFFLYARANRRAISRMERAQLPTADIDHIGRALVERRVIDGKLFAHLGPVQRDDVITQFADFCLRFEKISWVFASGVLDGNLVVAVRNVGYLKNAGEVTAKAFGDVGNAGGRRTMAKAIIPIKGLRAQLGGTATKALRAFIEQRILSQDIDVET